jgi:hypothetical protein
MENSTAGRFEINSLFIHTFRQEEQMQHLSGFSRRRRVPRRVPMNIGNRE